MKRYEPHTKRMLYSLNPDFYFDLDEEYWQLLDILTSEKLDGSDRYTQWMMKLETRYKDLLDTIRELDECPQSPYIAEMLARTHLVE